MFAGGEGEWCFLVDFGERKGKILCADGLFLFKREVHFLFIKQNDREQNIKCCFTGVPLKSPTAADN